MTSMRRQYVASTSLRRHVPAGNLAPSWPPNILNLGPPNILNLPTPMNHIQYESEYMCIIPSLLSPSGNKGAYQTDKTDLDFWNALEGKNYLIANFFKTA